MSAARIARSRRKGLRRKAVRSAATAPIATKPVSRRLPYSMAPWVSSSVWMTAPWHLGQVGQPRPEPVRRTAAPVKTMSTSRPKATALMRAYSCGDTVGRRIRRHPRVAAMSRLRSLYARAYRRLPVPRSQALRLPDAPLSRRFGLDRGRPVDRLFIERFLASHAGDVRGRVLEVYEDTYARRFGSASSVDVVDATPGRATLVGDLREPGWLPDAAFDCVILTQTLHSALRPDDVLRFLAPALAPGGVVLATFAGVSQRSRAGEDPSFLELWRFTSDGVRSLFSASGFAAEVRAYGNVLACASFLYGMAEHETDPRAFEVDDPDYELVVCARATLEA